VEKISDLKGKSIISADGKSVGRLVDLSIDEVKWRVTSMVVEVEPALAALFGAKKKLLKAPRVKIGVDKVELIGDVVKLHDNLQDLKVELHGV